jgi:tetratricopeptide (TPR) repeat protein
MEALKIGEYGLAEEHLSDAVRKGFEHPQVFSGLALACKYQDKNDEAIHWSEKALEMDDKNSNALTTLGTLHYDRHEWGLARSYYSRSLSVDPRQNDPLFRLSLLALMDQDFSGCVTYCDRLMALLHLSTDRVIEKVEDIADIYEEIGDAFLRLGENRIHQEAISFSRALKGKAQ